MRKRYFLKLVHKHLSGKATVEEEQLLLSYYNLFEAEPDVLALLDENELQHIKDQINTSIWQRISIQEKSADKIKRLKISYLKVAAAVLIGTVITCAVFLLRQQPKKHLLANQQIEQKNENRFIHLPDGSLVIVMKGSKITYPSTFEGLNRREVHLEGQAFFNIKHNADKPFIVYTGDVKTTVLGTAFNIKALAGNNNVIVTVTRGKVSISNKEKVIDVLTPGQQILYDKIKASSIRQKPDNIFMYWASEDLLFDDVTMDEATDLLSKRFKVEIVFKDQVLKQNRFTATFQRGESLENVLDIICEFNNAVYTYNKEKSVITIDNKTN